MSVGAALRYFFVYDREDHDWRPLNSDHKWELDRIANHHTIVFTATGVPFADEPLSYDFPSTVIASETNGQWKTRAVPKYLPVTEPIRLGGVTGGYQIAGTHTNGGTVTVVFEQGTGSSEALCAAYCHLPSMHIGYEKLSHDMVISFGGGGPIPDSALTVTHNSYLNSAEYRETDGHLTLVLHLTDNARYYNVRSGGDVGGVGNMQTSITIRFAATQPETDDSM